MAEPSRAELKYLVERQREEIKTLNDLGRLLTATNDPAAILQQTASYLRHTYPVALCGIWSLERRQLSLVPFAPLSQVELGSAVATMRSTISAALNRPLADEECRLELDRASGAPSVSGQPSTTLRSHLSAPLAVKGQTIGLLSLFSGQAEAFTSEDQSAIGIIAEQVGVALRNAYLVQELRRADELKDQLLSIVSHELGTPLTAIKEGVSMVIEGALGETTPDQQDFLKTVMENAERLERLIEKVKTSGEIMAGQVQYAFESFDLRTLLASVQKTYQGLADLRGVQFRFIEYPKPLFWQIDHRRLTLAVSQLVENALQATEKNGFVTVSLTPSANEVQIVVQDTGAGIPKDALPSFMTQVEETHSLFDRFQSLGGIHDRKMGGLGLGLFIANSLIEGHGGSITVESAVGEGTSMIVRLPKEPSGGARRDVTGRTI